MNAGADGSKEAGGASGGTAVEYHFLWMSLREIEMPADEEFNIRQLSLLARVAVALRLLSIYCERRGLAHLEVDRFVDHQWRFLTVPVSETVRTWEDSTPPLTATALGYEFPPEFEEFLVRRNVPPNEFRSVLASTAEVLYGSMYGAANEPESRKHLLELASFIERFGIEMPSVNAFSPSRWADRDGWGNPLSIEEVAKWRDS